MIDTMGWGRSETLRQLLQAALDLAYKEDDRLVVLLIEAAIGALNERNKSSA